MAEDDQVTKPWAENAVCKLLGCQVPVVLAGMGGVARSELVSAVTVAGGFGFLGMVREPVALIEREVERVRAAGHTKFGVNIIPAATEKALLDRQIDAIIALQVPVVELFWDIDASVVDRFRKAGITVVYQIGSVGEAIDAEQVGAQVIVAQGVEAGGHVRGTVPLRNLLPAVIPAVRVPVLAAGGLAQGADLTIAMALGAQGAVLGTALMATTESFAHAYHRQRLVAAKAADTVLTNAFHINWPQNAAVRVLQSPVISLETDKRPLQMIGEEEGRPIYLFSTDSPLRSMTGDFAAMALYAGTGVEKIDAIVGAEQRINEFLLQAEATIPSIAPVPLVASSGVCFAGEFSGDYMGHVKEDELVRALTAIGATLYEMLQLTLATADLQILPQLPFAAKAAPLAGWLIRLREFCVPAATSDFVPPQSSDIQPELLRLRIQLRRDLGALLPRMAEDRLRQTLSGLGQFLATALPDDA